MRRALFLDRDGVINRNAAEGEYILSWEEIEILPGVAEAIALINQAGFAAVVVTNQRGVAKGLVGQSDLEWMHVRLKNYLAKSGATIDAIYYCPHDTQPPCRCRKPKTGMLLDAARDLGIDLTVSWMIGDSQKDIEAGVSAGCKTVHITGGGKTSVQKADISAPNLLAAVRQILSRDAPKGHSEMIR
jgi:D-glycero-D-manno-heptose 1,7-bisphosphate phosphatase